MDKWNAVKNGKAEPSRAPRGEPVLKVENLSISFRTSRGEVQAVRDVSFALEPGEVLAIVGESGCGKSALCRGIMRLLPSNGFIRSGRIFAGGVDIAGCRENDIRKLRGSFFSMVLQNPMTALNPTMTVGSQIAEAVRVYSPGISKAALRERTIELMELVGINSAEQRYAQYPCHFSGGMRQRCVMAIALAANPKVLFADEPTTALDVTIQAQILDLLRNLQRKLGTAAILVTHDLGVVARAADRVAVMYAGKLVEVGTVEDIFYSPRHPYTWGLLRSLPARARAGEPLYTIPGMPPSLIDPPKGDAFACRNEYALAIDYEEAPPSDAVEVLKSMEQKNEYAFTSPYGGPMSPDSVLRMLQRVLKRAGLERIRFHDLRHTFSVLALQNGVDVKTLSAMLGHYSAGFTLDTYAHVTTSMQKQAANAVGNFLSGTLQP